MSELKNNEQVYHDEKLAKTSSGGAMLLLIIILQFALTGLFVFSIVKLEAEQYLIGGVSLSLSIIALCLSFILYGGIKVVRPNEALVLTLFGKYSGSIKKPGFYYVNPFSSLLNPASATVYATNQSTSGEGQANTPAGQQAALAAQRANRRISLKAMTLNNEKQKINDELGNPIIIGVVVIWRVINTAKAVFNVDNYKEYLTIQCDAALRNIVRLYPYDSGNNAEDSKLSLRGSSQEISDHLKIELQKSVDIAGLEIIEARITHLAYAPEIAAAMLQRQQASAVVDARQMIVEGAVGMVEMALEKLNEKDIVHLDEERKAAMVSNLLVVLCGNKDAQPIVNSGSIY